MKFQTRVQKMQAIQKRMEAKVTKRGMRIKHIAETTKNARIRKKAEKWIKGMMEISMQAMTGLTFFSPTMTDREIIAKVRREQRKPLELSRKHGIRMQGLTGLIGVFSLNAADTILADMRQKRQAIETAKQAVN